MPYLEPEVHVLVEDVLDAEMFDPLWIEVVVYDFCFTRGDPWSVLLVAMAGLEGALWVRNGQEIQIR